METRRKSLRNLATFDRTDQWALGVLLTLIAAGSLLSAVLGPILDARDGKALRIPYSGDVTVAALDRVGQHYGRANYDILLSSPTTGQRLLDALPGVLGALMVVTGCVLIGLIMREIGSGRPFQSRTVHLLRGLAALILIGPWVQSFAASACAGRLLDQVNRGGLPWLGVFDFPLWTLVVGLVVAMIAEGFKAGIKMQEDTEGLI